MTAKLDHNGYLIHQLRMSKQDPNGKDVRLRHGVKTSSRSNMVACISVGKRPNCAPLRLSIREMTRMETLEMMICKCVSMN